MEYARSVSPPAPPAATLSGTRTTTKITTKAEHWRRESIFLFAGSLSLQEDVNREKGRGAPRFAHRFIHRHREYLRFKRREAEESSSGDLDL